ncbi:hypothetical protein ACSO1_21390 [Acinetobacter calcoaceticus]|nr:hypothetical protein ACSO1_21390 [Acinetobacter calcoaceticus]
MSYSEKRQRPVNQINNYYKKAAKLYQTQYEKLNKDNPNAQYVLCSSFSPISSKPS